MSKFLGNDASHEVIHRLEKAGHEAVFVGGAVRDYVLGRPSKDIDIATSAEPAEVKAVFSNTVDVGIVHGTVLVLVKGEPIEVTTYRTEGMYTDSRRPDEVHFVKSLREDLLRRDFTMNALAMTKDGELIDLFDGRKDMENGIIRAVGNPADRFREDALRMLRAVRFSSVLKFEIEDQTFQAIRESATQLRQISIERLKIEMDKLFTGANPVKALDYLFSTGLNDNMPLFPDKLEGLICSVPFQTAAEGWSFLTIAGRFLPSDVARSYKLSNEERKFIANVHEAFTKRTNREFSVDDYYLYHLSVLKAAEKFFGSIYPDAITLTDKELEEQKKSLPIQSIKDLSVDGKDLIKWSGQRGGRWTGEWIEKIEYTVLHGLCENDSTKIRDWFINDFKREK